MQKLKYVGPYDDGVEIPALGLTLVYGEEFDVDDDDFVHLADQPDNYEPVGASRTFLIDVLQYALEQWSDPEFVSSITLDVQQPLPDKFTPADVAAKREWFRASLRRLDVEVEESDDADLEPKISERAKAAAATRRAAAGDPDTSSNSTPPSVGPPSAGPTSVGTESEESKAERLNAAQADLAAALADVTASSSADPSQESDDGPGTSKAPPGRRGATPVAGKDGE